jgi:hypothetical protein
MNKARVASLQECILGSLLLIAALISLVVASEAAKKREFSGKAEFLFCKKGNGGRWEVFDKWEAHDLSFKVSVIDIAIGKEFTSGGVWEGDTEKGRHISTRLSGPGKAKVNLTDGSVDVEIPFQITVEDKNLSDRFNATSETTEGAAGPIRGHRAVFDAAAHTLKIDLVGSKRVRVPAEIVDGTSNTRAGTEETTILVVARLRGTFKKTD